MTTPSPIATGAFAAITVAVGIAWAHHVNPESKENQNKAGALAEPQEPEQSAWIPPLPGFSTTRPAQGRSVAVEGGYLTAYTATLPGTDVTFEMIPIAGGVVQLGPPEGPSPPEEQGFAVSPRVRVKVDPYWIGRCEVTWAEYWRYMDLNSAFAKLQQLRDLAKQVDPKAALVLKKHKALWTRVNAKPDYVDGVTSPTPLYDPDVTYESGEEPDLPAVTMTHYAARQYTKWLSLTTGNDYRLPTEAEWEHAARAGGDGRAPEPQTEVWHSANADYASHPVGKLAPNAWGLHDTLGNAAEWVLDDPKGELRPTGDQPIPAAQAIVWPTRGGSRMAKGGYWDVDAKFCTAESRMLSDEVEWKGSDPNLPKSPWWYADYPSHGVGFRLLRPLKPMDQATRRRVWEIDNQDLQDDVDHRVNVGRRGKLGLVDKELPRSLQLLDAPDVNGLLE